MPMKNPPHPGVVVRELCLDPLGLSVTKAAEGLGVSRKALSELLNGHSGISPEMAIRLSKGFGGSPESWLRQQMYYDLAQAQNRASAIQVTRFEHV
jgi:addiction module HigA family antidote